MRVIVSEEGLNRLQSGFLVYGVVESDELLKEAFHRRLLYLSWTCLGREYESDDCLFSDYHDGHEP